MSCMFSILDRREKEWCARAIDVGMLEESLNELAVERWEIFHISSHNPGEDEEWTVVGWRYKDNALPI